MIPTDSGTTAGSSCFFFKSDLKYLFFLDFEDLGDLVGIAIGQFLDILFADLIVVLGNLTRLLLLLEILDRVAADIPDGNLRLFGVLAEVLDDLLAAFLGQRRDNEANGLAVVLGIYAELRGLYRLFDRLYLRNVPGGRS